MKSSVCLLGYTACKMVKVRLFWETYICMLCLLHVVSNLTYPSTLKMEAMFLRNVD
jgi:hypothetical protein